ncbi:hypothetical protein [Microcoleus sp. PH2017_02_FOX_O_A]|uniref:hypothetical protein n=1 Tax=Microcoleus sp. PH2017_02_FOX_O_A TaxID=2798813 RepID=UPI0025DB436C|nr:hypothetical protein [Microcoleus sp. PH2017_02_FOX_O_A]
MAVAINIPVGNPNIPSDRPESIAPTNNATRAYVTMRNTGRVSVVDLMALREIDIITLTLPTKIAPTSTSSTSTRIQQLIIPSFKQLTSHHPWD